MVSPGILQQFKFSGNKHMDLIQRVYWIKIIQKRLSTSVGQKTCRKRKRRIQKQIIINHHLVLRKNARLVKLDFVKQTGTLAPAQKIEDCSRKAYKQNRVFV